MNQKCEGKREVQIKYWKKYLKLQGNKPPTGKTLDDFDRKHSIARIKNKEYRKINALERTFEIDLFKNGVYSKMKNTELRWKNKLEMKAKANKSKKNIPKVISKCS